MKSAVLFLRQLLPAALVLVCGEISSQPGAEAVHSGEMMKFSRYSYVDRLGTGLEAFHFLIPSGWQFEGGITWLLDNTAMPASTAFRVFDPAGVEAFEVFPNQCYYWSDNPQLLALHPPGSRYFGSIIRMPVLAIEALAGMVEQYWKRAHPDLSVLSYAELPELVEALGAGQMAPGLAAARATAAKMRIAYGSDGGPLEEEIYAVVEEMTFPIQSMYGTFYNTIWFVDYIFSFRAEAGKLDAAAPMFQTMVTSFSVNPAWYGKYVNVIEYLAQAQIRQIRSVGEFSRMLSNMSEQMRTDQLQQFESRSQVYDRLSQKFSDNILGIDRYFDPFEGREVELPSGYNHAWCNNNGEYILTDNPNFNPNVGSNLGWQPLDRK